MHVQHKVLCACRAEQRRQPKLSRAEPKQTKRGQVRSLNIEAQIDPFQQKDRSRTLARHETLSNRKPSPVEKPRLTEHTKFK